jgi:hypothetical protein
MTLNPQQGVFLLYRATVNLGAKRWVEADADAMAFAKAAPSWIKVRRRRIKGWKRKRKKRGSRRRRLKGELEKKGLNFI